MWISKHTRAETSTNSKFEYSKIRVMIQTRPERTTKLNKALIGTWTWNLNLKAGEGILFRIVQSSKSVGLHSVF